ncbi:hypothetical protein [Jatrophihabitans lederbergiae]|uniref:Transcriptional regulator n=1 Tax=Jatrophihabitans lederbergiae TaxID=3075547 RepID=A0ABU2J4B0_9ACTN|nr:hypothetical protein [Jatrophihabitans sp. DSM 44399]MDT0259829.1 hypothetical protein [Jatrophihabitans sp. DSM 44399]
MTSPRRWLVVLAGIAVLVALPSAVGALPSHTPELSASQLLTRIQHSASTPYSGYAQSTGGLSLPVTNQFSSIADLFGGQSQLRVWWRSTDDWRVDSVGIAGETDVRRSARGYWTWNYESNSATWTEQPQAPRVRLPTAVDLTPPELGRRLLSEALPREASRIGSDRIAGHSAAGLRIQPDAQTSSIDHVDVWADPATGLPLRVVVRGKQALSPAVSSSFLDLSLATPSASVTAFSPPANASISSGTSQDLATAIDQLAGVVSPANLAGIARNTALPKLGSVGVYGRGVTEFVAVPLPGRAAYLLRQQLGAAKPTSSASPGDSTVDSNADFNVSVGPLNLLLSNSARFGSAWLLVGTVQSTILTTAAAELPPHPELP